MNTTQQKCAVCGCRIEGVPHNNKNTCDGICTRAHEYGRSRGKQMEAEVRAAARARSEEESNSFSGLRLGLGYRSENDYNQPYLWAAA